ncbi:MAG: T9SS type A sorting domain-containing protein [Bacteroidales bacterium]|nr:T9SS type A sorting domain-containing protein [Bacteroidales bacterium]
MTPFVGKQITTIKVGLNEPASLLSECSVWIRSALTGADLYTQTFTPIEGWNIIELETPYPVTATDIYIGYTVTTTGGDPLGFTDNTQEAAYGGHFQVDGGAWTTLAASTLPGNNAIIAVVAQGKITITTDVSPVGAGIVTGGGEHEIGTSVTLTASANSGYLFLKWDDEVTTNPRIFDATTDETYTAIFELMPVSNLIVTYDANCHAELSWESPAKVGGFKAVAEDLPSKSPAVWDVLWNLDLNTTTGRRGDFFAPFLWDGKLYVSEYSDVVRGRVLRYTKSGDTWLADGSITVPGITGDYNFVGFTTDGEYIYGVTEGFSIYRINPATWTVASTITTSVRAGSVAYDSQNDAFWVSEYEGRTAQLISRTGIASTTLTGATRDMTSMAWENTSDGTPYLWVQNQNNTNLGRWNVSTGVFQAEARPTTDVPGLNHEGSAAGMFYGLDHTTGRMALVCLNEGHVHMNARVWAYDMGNAGELCDVVTNLMGTAQGNNVLLTWTAPQGSPTGYEIICNGAVIATTTATSYTHSNLLDGSYTYDVKALFAGNCFPIAVTTKVTVGFCDETADLIVGTGEITESFYPITTSRYYSYSQLIYDAEELGEGPKTINALSFQYVHTVPINMPRQTIYLGNTTKDAFSSTSDWVPLAEMEQVFAGYINLSNETPWVTIHFDKPFHYTGDNLVVAVWNNTGDDVRFASEPAGTFRQHATEANRNLTYHVYVAVIDPANPPAAALNPLLRPNIKFEACSPPPVTYNVYRNDVLIASNITATSYTDATFDPTLPQRWSVSVAAGSEESEKVSVDKDPCLATYMVTIETPLVGGTIEVLDDETLVTDGTELQEGTELTLTAIPDAGYRFGAWWDGETNPTRTLTLESDTTISATFIKTYVVTIVEPDPTEGTLAVIRDGSVVVSTGTVLDVGTELTLTAIPDAGYRFGAWWDGDTEPTRTLTLESDITISATFIKTYIVTILEPEHGTITVTMGSDEPVTTGMVLDAGTALHLEAEGDETYYELLRWWDGDENLVRTIYLDSNTTIYALFHDTRLPTYTVTIVSSIGGDIEVMVGQTRIDDQDELDVGTELTLTAIPDAGYRFGAWWDGETNPTRTLTLESDTTISATFIKTYIVTILEPEHGTITVTMSNDEPVTTGMVLDAGTALHLEAEGEETYYALLRWWDGDENPVRTIYLDSNTTIYALFHDTRLPTYTVTIVSPIGGDIEVMVGQTRIDDQDELDVGTELTLTAIPDAGYRFGAWWDGETEPTRTLTLESDTTISATFIKTYVVTIVAPEHGTITVTMGNDEPVTTGMVLDAGTALHLEAEGEETYYALLRWWDGDENPVRTIHLDSNTTIYALFHDTRLPTYTVTIVSPIGGDIEVMVGQTRIDDQDELDEGTELTLTAIPDAGYRFGAWWDGETEPTRTLTLESDTTISATFIKTYVVTILEPEHGTITVTMGSDEPVTTGMVLDAGTELTLTAIPNANYEFISWWDEALTENPYTVFLANDLEISAVIVPQPVSIRNLTDEYTLSIHPNPVKDIVHIETDGPIKQIVLMDLHGRLLRTWYGDHRSLDLQALPAGTYLLHVHTDKAIMPIKFVK